MKPKLPKFAHSQRELADIIGQALDIEVTDRSIRRLIHRYSKPRDGGPAAPKTTADNKYPVAPWIEFFQERNIKRVADDEATTGEGADGMTAREWKARRERANALSAELELEKASKKLINRAEVEKFLGQTLSSFRRALDNIAPRVAKAISGKMEYDQKADIIQKEVDAAMRIMEALKFEQEEVAA
jgi:hypothetical protein